MDPQTGEILAMATTPRMNLNNYTDYFQVYDNGSQYNRSIGMAYEAGSVVKVLTMAAALDDHLALVQQAPDDAAAWFNLGYVLETDGQWQPALDAFARACELDPQMDRAWYGQGLVLIRLQRFDEAAAALRRNTELQPMSPYGWYQLARVHIDRQAPDEAVKIIRHLRGFEPKVAAQLERETGLLLGQPAT
jgi:tetratricopeptide (TPR) repeat protein